ncbi:MAG: hypothetical protein EP314_02505 [Bacteroidetes bacterium]|nr:MAG: hypothetical protein EP314_02505 [Bacteroidota bacterium]
MRSLTLLLALAMAVALPACKECSEDDKRPKEHLGPDYWPLYGTWRLLNVGMDEHQNASGESSGYMHEITWDADGTFVVEWANEVIQVGHVEKIVKETAVYPYSFLITVELESDCPKKNPWFEGEYVLSAGVDSSLQIGSMSLGGYSFPWGDSNRAKVLLYEKL